MNGHAGEQEKTLLAIALAAIALVWGILAFSLVALYVLPSPGRNDVPPPLVHVVTMSSPPTLVHALPSPPLPNTPVPTATPIPTPTPIPTAAPSNVIVGKDTTVLALLGIDDGLDSAIWRTDTMILVFVEGRKRRMAMLSLPRDLWVSIPGYNHNRLNTVDSLGERTNYVGGGPALLDQTLRQNLGLRMDHYVRIDYEGFVRIVDAIGGVTVNVEKPIRDQFPDPLSPSGTAQITLPAGLRQMDGHMALSYCRSRISADDFDRSGRQQQVLVALLKKTLTPGALLQAPKLWAEFKGSFQTDLTMVQAVQLAYMAYDIGLDNMRTKHLDWTTARPWTTPDGAQVLVPQIKAIQETVIDLLSETER